MPSLIKCAQCGEELEDGALFCIKCGAGVDAATPDAGLICKSCGAVLKPSASFCNQCGAKTAAPPVSTAPSESGVRHKHGNQETNCKNACKSVFSWL